MAGFTDLAEDDFLDHFFTNTTFPNVGDVAGLLAAAVPGVFTSTLHTGTAITDASTLLSDNEVAYTGFARQTHVRGTSDFTVGTPAGQVVNDLLIQYGNMTAGGPDTVTDVSLGFATGSIMQVWGLVAIPLVINNGVNPQFAVNALVITID